VKVKGSNRAARFGVGESGMGGSVVQQADGGHPVRGETSKLRMAKVGSAVLPKREEGAEREQFGRILKCVQHVVGKNRDEMALWLGIDPRQLGRWYAGTETAQMWRYHRDPTLRRTLRLVEALDDSEGATVETTIRSRLNLGTEGVGE
jgi:hypothetical protein